MTGASVFKNLPPQVARELRRHVSPRPLVSPLKGTAASGGSADQAPKSYKGLVAGLVVFTTGAFSIPLIAHAWIGGLTDRDSPLTGPQVRRGAFNNSGTKDVGRDPDWDFPTGTYKKPTGYAAMVEQEADENNLSSQFLALDPKVLKKHDEKMKAFALGKAKND